MGNTQSNRVEDRRWANNSESMQQPPNVGCPGVDKGGIELINAQQVIGLGDNQTSQAELERYRNKYDLE